MANARSRVNRGNIRRERGELDRAIDDFTVAISVEPNLIEAFLGRSAARGEKGDADGAVADSETAVKIDPEVVKSGDLEMLEDLVTSAVNAASTKVDQAMQSSMGGMLGGMGIPGL